MYGYVINTSHLYPSTTTIHEHMLPFIIALYTDYGLCFSHNSPILLTYLYYPLTFERHTWCHFVLFILISQYHFLCPYLNYVLAVITCPLGSPSTRIAPLDVLSQGSQASTPDLYFKKLDDRRPLELCCLCPAHKILVSSPSSDCRWTPLCVTVFHELCNMTVNINFCLTKYANKSYFVSQY